MIAFRNSKEKDLEEVTSTYKLEKQSDEQLVDLVVRTQNQYAISLLYDRYSHKIFSRSLSFVKDREIAEDLTHDIFMKILMSLASFKGKSKFSTWIYSITYNYCVDYLRKRQKIRFQHSEFQKENDSYVSEEEVADARDLQTIKVDRLLTILEEINPEEKMILMMKYRDGLSIKQIQTIFDLSESAVKMRLKRAKEKVKKVHSKKFNQLV